MNDEDNERDNLYARAESISAELGIMTLELKSCIDNVNSRAGGQGEASDPLSKVVHILNNQLQALSNVDDSSEQVTRRLEQLTGMYIVSVTACLPVEHTKLQHMQGVVPCNANACPVACNDTMSDLQDSLHKKQQVACKLIPH